MSIGVVQSIGGGEEDEECKEFGDVTLREEQSDGVVTEEEEDALDEFGVECSRPKEFA